MKGIIFLFLALALIASSCGHSLGTGRPGGVITPGDTLHDTIKAPKTDANAPEAKGKS